MAGIAAVYSRESNNVWLNYLLEDIVASNRGDTSCIGAGQAFDDDLVYALEGEGTTDIRRNKSARSARRESARRLLSANEVPQRSLSERSTRSDRSQLPSPRLSRSPSSAHPPETLPQSPPVVVPEPLNIPGIRVTPDDEVPSDDVPATGPERPSPYRIPTIRFSQYPGSVRSARERLHRQTLSISSTYSNTIVGSEAGEDEKASRRNSEESVDSDNTFPTHPGVRPLAVRRWTMEPSILEHPDTEYPKPLPLALIVFGVCLSVFIISLDRSIITTVGCPESGGSIFKTIQLANISIAGHSTNHQSIPLSRRYWMVWKRVSSDRCIVPTTLWPHFHDLQYKDNFPHLLGYF